MTPASSQLRAHIPPSPGVDIEATSGRPEDYDDRNGYLPNFLGEGNDLVVPLPLLRDKATSSRSSEHRRKRRLSSDTKTSALS
jgi:hypothetical protein